MRFAWLRNGTRSAANWLMLAGLTVGLGSAALTNTSSSVTTTLAATTSQTGTDEWTQDQHDAQHTGGTSEEPAEGWSYAWSWNGADANGGSSAHTYNAPREARTVVGAGHIYAPAGAQGLYALNLTDGSQAWHLSSPAFNATPAFDPTTGALFAGGADGTLYKLSPTNGQILARYSAGAALNKAVLLVGSFAYVVDTNGALHKVDTATLTRQWIYSTCTAQCTLDTPAAYSPSRDALIFATGDLVVHAVNNRDANHNPGHY
jgi:outer membrane protein assembly factor BamB